LHRDLHSCPTRRSSDLDQDHPLTTDIEEKLSRGPSRVKAGHRFCPPETVRRQDPQRAECPPGNLETKCAPCRSSLLDYTQGSSRSEEHTSELQSRENLV